MLCCGWRRERARTRGERANESRALLTIGTIKRVRATAQAVVAWTNARRFRDLPTMWSTRRSGALQIRLSLGVTPFLYLLDVIAFHIRSADLLYLLTVTLLIPVIVYILFTMSNVASCLRRVWESDNNQSDLALRANLVRAKRQMRRPEASHIRSSAACTTRGRTQTASERAVHARTHRDRHIAAQERVKRVSSRSSSSATAAAVYLCVPNVISWASATRD